MGRLLGAAVVPSAPLVTPAVAPSLPPHARDVADLRRLATAAVAGLPDADAVVLVAGGRRSVHASATVDLRPLGFPEVARRHPVATELLPDVTSRTQAAQRHSDDLETDLAVLALQLAAGTPVLPVAIAPADGASLAATGRALVSAIRDSSLDVTLLCAGDLSAALDRTSPRYHVEGAASWDAVTTTAVNELDVDALVAQGEDAERVHARSWAPLVVGVAAVTAAGLRPVAVTYQTARGVGHVVGRFARP